MKVVSVIMITYGHEEYIEQAILGVLSQNCGFEFEFIIADDNSPDNTEEIIRRIAKDHPRGDLINYTKHEVNKGMVANFSWAVSQSVGRYIAICEGDDYWIDALKLAKQVEFLELNPEYGIVFTDASVLYQKTGKLITSYDKVNKRRIPTGYVLENLVQQNPYKTCTALFRSELISGFYDFKLELEKKFTAADSMLWMNIASKSKVGYLEDCTSVYRILESSSSHFSSIIGLKRFHKNVYKMILFYSSRYGISIKRRRHKTNYLKALIQYLIVNGEYSELLCYKQHLHIIASLLVKEKVVRPLVNLIS